MPWTNGDLKIFAAGLSIGARWNHTFGTLPKVQSSLPPGTYWYTSHITLSCPAAGSTIMYSTDGGTPTRVYGGEEIFIGHTMDVYAYAILGLGISSMSQFRYIIDNPFVPTERVTMETVLPDSADAAICRTECIVLTVTDAAALNGALPETSDGGAAVII